MRTLLKYIVIILLLQILILRFSLAGVPEPLRVQIWEALQTYMPVLGVTGLAVAALLALKLKTWVRPHILLTTVFSALCLILPYSQSLTRETYPATIASTKDDLYIRLPLNEETVVAWGGDKVKTNYHAAYADQRWAYDLVVEPHSIRSANLKDYGCFGKEVVAPISGKIRTAHDGESDRVPDENAPDIQNAYGNYIVVKPDGSDNRLIIAHLKQGSLRVKRGDKITEGQPIAQCGNSGNSTEPHVHIHYVRLFETGNGILMTGLPLYFRNHNGPPMPTGGFGRVNGHSVMTGTVVRHIPKPSTEISKGTSMDE